MWHDREQAPMCQIGLLPRAPLTSSPSWLATSYTSHGFRKAQPSSSAARPKPVNAISSGGFVNSFDAPTDSCPALICVLSCRDFSIFFRLATKLWDSLGTTNPGPKRTLSMASYASGCAKRKWRASEQSELGVTTRTLPQLSEAKGARTSSPIRWPASESAKLGSRRSATTSTRMLFIAQRAPWATKRAAVPIRRFTIAT
eukprot:scaffold471_cov235-Pinguiococcus_pyrenoidosus.AAC.1